MVIGGTVGFFQDLLSGGSGGLPGWIVWKLNHRGGNLQLWAQIIGIDPTLAPSWQPTARIQLVEQATKGPQRPLAKTPEYQRAPQAPSAPRMSFGACLGLSAPASVPAAGGCLLFGGYCASALFGNPSGALACPSAVGFCGFTAAIGIGCYASSRGTPPQAISPDLGNFPPTY